MKKNEKSRKNWFSQASSQPFYLLLVRFKKWWRMTHASQIEITRKTYFLVWCKYSRPKVFDTYLLQAKGLFPLNCMLDVTRVVYCLGNKRCCCISCIMLWYSSSNFQCGKALTFCLLTTIILCNTKFVKQDITLVTICAWLIGLKLNIAVRDNSLIRKIFPKIRFFLIGKTFLPN